MTRLSIAPALLAALLLAGCADAVPVPTTVSTTGMPNPETALRASMRHVDAEMAELGQLTPTAHHEIRPVVPEDLQRVVSFDWSGPLDNGVAKLALSIGYSFYTTGPAGSPPLPVTIHVTSVPAFQVLRTLGEAAGTRATVRVDPLHHQVEVIHHV